MTASSFGPQYLPDDDFKRRARLHQSRYRVEQLGASEFREYGNRLSTADALAGRNFCAWPGMMDAVAKRFPLEDKKLYFDMLASDHIPFNLFIPLKGHAATIPLVSNWANVDVSEIETIEIEWAPAPKNQFLDDSTSFDAYIAYRTRDGSLGAVGVEVKFTEREYSWGTTERARMFDPNSHYNVVHQASQLYAPNSLQYLQTPRLKQLWRNQLLGESMLQHRALNLSHFTSVLIHPAGNTHFSTAAQEYQQLLAPTPARAPFRSLTYETFIGHCRGYATSAQYLSWIEYLTQRYIVA